MAHLAQTPTNMSSIGEVCDRLGKTFLMSLLGNLSATGGLRVNSSSVKGGVINFSLFLLEANAILPRTPKAACAFENHTFSSYLGFHWIGPLTGCLGCPRQYCIPLEQEQRKAYNTSLHWRRVHPESASSTEITEQWHQECLSEPIANFSDWAHIWWSLR